MLIPYASVIGAAVCLLHPASGAAGMPNRPLAHFCLPCLRSLMPPIHPSRFVIQITHQLTGFTGDYRRRQLKTTKIDNPRHDMDLHVYVRIRVRHGFTFHVRTCESISIGTVP